MAKITFLGAGSTVFARNLMGDILSFPELADSTITLHDIDEERLETSEKVGHHVAEALGAGAATIEATTDRRAALDGADYAIAMIQVAGYRPGTVIDFDIPRKHGLHQTIADTLGIGGIMRGLRTIPVLLDMCRDMEELCPEVTFLNYVNPMAMNCWAISRATTIRTVGLCHSVQGTAAQIARDIDVPYRELNYLCAGINHMAFYLKLGRHGDEGTEDLYPRLGEVIREQRVPKWNRVRYEMFKRLGYFVTESSEHFAEYVPWFIKQGREDLIEDFNVPLDEYLRRCVSQIAGWEKLRQQFESGEAEVSVQRSHEYGSRIIHSMETGQERVIYGNVVNEHLIDNLPQGCCVEVPVLVNGNGLQPTRIGSLPPHLAALMQTNINVQSLTVEAALTRKREHIYHAAMLDPHTAAELDLDQIWHMVDELIGAHGDWLPEYH